MEVDDDELLDAVNNALPPKKASFESLKDVPMELIKDTVWIEFLDDYVLFDLERSDIKID